MSNSSPHWMAHPVREGTAVYFLAFSMPFSAIVPEIPDGTPREPEQLLSSKLPQGRARHCCRVEAGFQLGCACSATNQVLSQPLCLLILKCQAGHLLLNGTISASKMRCVISFCLFFFLFSPPPPPLHPPWPFKPSARLMQDSGMKPTTFGSFVQSYFIRTTDSSQWKLFHKSALLSSRQKCCRSRLLMFLNMFTSINVLCYTSSPISHGRLIYSTPVFPHPGAVLCQLHSYQFCGRSVLWAHFLQDKK